MKAREIMRKPVIATTPRASVRDIANQLVEKGFSGMPVAERDGTVVGIITEADILRAFSQNKQLEKLTAENIMSTEPTTVDVETPIEAVILVLQELHVLRVPVTEGGKLVGIISRSDVIRAVIEPEFMVF